MSKAAAELPDTLEPGDGPDKPVNVDDLLAQMAGEEIDRLLSEGDDAPAKAVPPPPATPAPQPPVSEDGVAKQLDELFSGSDAPIAEPTPPATELATAKLVPQSVEPTEPSAVVGPAATETLAPDGVRTKGGLIEAEVAGGVVVRDEPSTDEDVHDAEFEDSDAAERAAIDAPLDEEDLGDEEEPVPLYLKPLTLINSPLENSPDWIRDLLGKLALLTLFNAAAVLLYVLLFRRHH